MVHFYNFTKNELLYGYFFKHLAKLCKFKNTSALFTFIFLNNHDEGCYRELGKKSKAGVVLI